MSKTTITINGEECVILPAPKGAFLIKEGFVFPYFVEYVALSTSDNTDDISIYGLELSFEGTHLEINQEDELHSEVTIPILQNLMDWDSECEDPESTVIYLYGTFKSHETPMDYTAIEWFKEKFKEYNITKADFDVFV